MQDVGFALAGCTHPHSRMHLRTLQVLPEVEAVYLWDPDLAAAEAVAREMSAKIAGVSADLEQALSQPGVECALVAVPNNLSPEIIARCAAAGRHVLAEKPLAVDAAHLRPALEAARNAGVALGVCYPNRWHPVAQDMRRLVAAGALGDLMTIEVRMVTSQVRFRDPSHWLFRKGAAGGGILSWLGCHYVDLVRYALGQEIVSVCAMVGTLGGEVIEVEDAAGFCFRTASGAIGTFHAGYLLPRSVAGYSGASYDTLIAVRGTQGNLRWEPHGKHPELRLESVAEGFASAPERSLTYTLGASEAYGGVSGAQFVRDFVRAARACEPVPASGEDGLRVLQVLDAVYESARTGRTVTVGE